VSAVEREAQLVDPGAVVGPAGPTGKALATPGDLLGADRVAGGQVADLRPDLGDHAGELVADDDRSPDEPWVPHVAVVVGFGEVEV
jgi:hypothetical protein